MAEDTDNLPKKPWMGLVALIASTLGAAGGSLALAGHGEKDSVIAILCIGIGALSTAVVVLWKKLESITDGAREEASMAAKADQALADALLSLTESHKALAQAILTAFKPIQRREGPIDN